MSKNNHNLIPSRLSIITAATALIGLSVTSLDLYATPFSPQSDAEPLILADTAGMENREDRRDGRQDNRGERGDDRRDCKGAEGAAGNDKRDCKQDARQDRNSD